MCGLSRNLLRVENPALVAPHMLLQLHTAVTRSAKQHEVKLTTLQPVPTSKQLSLLVGSLLQASGHFTMWTSNTCSCQQQAEPSSRCTPMTTLLHQCHNQYYWVLPTHPPGVVRPCVCCVVLNRGRVILMRRCPAVCHGVSRYQPPCHWTQPQAAG